MDEKSPEKAVGSGVFVGVFEGHNAAAAVFSGGRVQAVLQEERLTGIKNYHGPPVRAVPEVMSLAGVEVADVEGVCLASRYVSRPREPGYMKDNFDQRYRTNLRQLVQSRLSSWNAYREYRARKRMAQRRGLVRQWGLREETVSFYDHHEAHAATVYHGLRRDEEPYLVLTLDGGGDGLSGSVWTGRKGEMSQVVCIPREDSLGELYAVTTHLLGFMPMEHEYKLMGMAPYADQKYAGRIADIYHSYLGLEKDGIRFQRRVREPLSRIGLRLQRDLSRVRFDSLSAGLQLFTERMLVQWVKACISRTGIGRVLASGGVFMNVKANKAVSELAEVERFEAFPSAGDESLAFGVCYLAARQRGLQVRPVDHCYLGNDLTAEECREAAARVAGQVDVEEPSNMAGRVAELLAAGEIVARASGRMEFGARALGNRSILADPINQDVVRVINRMIKKRDFWMPFAPVVMRQKADSYFRNAKDLPSPYMMNTFDSTEKRGEFMAAVHNADLTARPQLLEEGQNPEYQAILEQFGELTGRHVLLNTSFNLHGSPIVCSAADAVGVLIESGLTRLVLGPLLLSKKS